MKSSANSNGKTLSPGPWQSIMIIIFTLIFFSIVYVIYHGVVRGSMDEKLPDDVKTTVTLILNDTAKTKYLPANFDSIKVDKACSFILLNLVPKDSAAGKIFRAKYGNLSSAVMLSILPAISVSTGSYFWLNTNKKYIEVIFWSIFGVLASLLYFISEAMRTNSFKPTEISVYLAKIFYAPLISVIIIFSYKLITSSNSAKFDNTSTELLVFSFILGFFSGRAIELLNKIKDIILPGKTTAEDEAANYSTIKGSIKLPQGLTGITPDKVKLSLIPSSGTGKTIEANALSDGSFKITGIPKGEYNLKAELESGDKKFSALIANKKIIAGKPLQVDDIILNEDK